MFPSGLPFWRHAPCASFTAHAVRVARLCLREYSVMLRDIDKASLHIAVRFKPCAVQVLGRLLAKVTSFGPREQFLPGAMLGARSPFTMDWI
jgi:hypothetical protein